MADLNDRPPDNRIAPPPPPRRAVSRPDLVARIERALDGGLVLLSAPAGFGKTSILAEWAARTDRPVAWLAIGPRDHDPMQFAAHLAAALRPLAPSAVDALAPLIAPGRGPAEGQGTAGVEAAIRALAGALYGAEPSSVLVMDDVHELADPAHWTVVEAFLAERPPSIALILASRSDPPLPLARWRLAGALAEFREADLRLDRDALMAVVAHVAGVSLTGAQAAVLEARTEGWAAGVQAAALALQDRQDVAAAVARFAGDHRFILDYLDEEVIDRQPPAVLSFLLDVAILDRLSPALCDAVRGTSSGDSAAWLDRLTHQGLFLQPLDVVGETYRFHRLFADRLRHRLERTAPDRAVALHRRAAAWFAANDDLDDAIAHALQGDTALAADLIGQAAPGRLAGRQAATVLGWLRALPEQALRADPRLMVAMAWALFAAESRGKAEPWLSDAEAVLAAPDRAAIDASPAARAEALGAAAALRAQMASWDGDVDEALRHSAVALDVLGPGSIWRANVALAVGAAHHLRGDVTAAIETFRSAVVDADTANRAEAAILARAMLAESLFLAGRLTEAAAVAEQALAQAEPIGGIDWPATARAGVVLGHIHLERNDLGAAAAAAERTIAAGRRASTRVLTFTGLLLRADVRVAAGDHAGAIEAVDEAAAVANEPALLADLAQFRAEIELDAGRPSAAVALERSRAAAARDPATPPPSVSAAMLSANVLLLQGRPADAEALIAPRVAECHTSGNGLAATRLRVLLALIRATRGRQDSARVLLAAALDDAEREGYVRSFAIGGPAMQALLRHVAADGGPHAATAQRILGALASDPPGASTRPEPPRARTGTEFGLSEREREVLGLVSEGLTNQEIADRLVISIATVKRHLTNIYGKLGADGRTRAVAFARARGMIG
ncbi:MAG: hypothetical protein IT332_02985 [Ardenticatenales bacterium]|nr:hypothetical protein [Ardenticatenales bacterium]